MVSVGALVGQGPTGTLAITLIPPTVEYREVEKAVHLSLLARSARGLKRTGGSIEPDVDTGEQTFRHGHIVILKENDFTQEFRTLRNLNDALDQVFTGAVGRVSLAGKDELHREFLVVHNFRQTVKVSKEEMRTLVGGEAASKAYEQSIGINLVNDRQHARGIALVFEPTGAEVLLHKFDKLVFQFHSHCPHVFVGSVENWSPSILIFLVIHKILSKELSVIFLPFRCGPSGHVHTVGDVSHVRLLWCKTFPYTLEHLARHLAMQPTHAIGLLGGVERKHTHRELFVGVRILTSHVHQVAPRNAQLGRELAHIFAKQSLVEIVVTSGHGSVNGVERRCTHHLKRHVEVKAFVLHIVDKALQVEQCCVTFVAVI